MHRSTRQFIKEARSARQYSFIDFLHGYFYSKWPYFYIGVATGEHRFVRYLRPITNRLEQFLAKKSDKKHPKDGSQKRAGPSKKSIRTAFADTYHGKVVSLDAAKELVTMDHEIQLTDLEKVIPYSLARDIILKNPDHIVVLDCPCRVSRSKPCQPLDVCLIVGEPFASFIAEHHPKHSRWISSDTAVKILKEEDQRGHVHHAFFKDAMLGRFYAICNCCSCCCGAMQAHLHGIPMLASSGYTVEKQYGRCLGCKECVHYCQFGAIQVQGDSIVANVEACMGCGVCVSKCRQKALQLVRNPEKGEPLELRNLLYKSIPSKRLNVAGSI